MKAILRILLKLPIIKISVLKIKYRSHFVLSRRKSIIRNFVHLHLTIFYCKNAHMQISLKVKKS
jgi:hypothetical protein